MRSMGVPTFVAALLPTGAECDETRGADPSPLVIEVAYTGETWRNVSGGLRRDSAYLDNMDVIATLDAGRALGLTGTTLLVSGLHNNRATLSDHITGDIQTVSNIDTDGATRLYEAWVQREHDGGAIKLGLMDLNSELDVNRTGALFINSSHGIGPDFSQVGENGPAIFPITGLGLLTRFDLSERAQLRMALVEATVGDPDHQRRTTVELESDEGALLVAELTYLPSESTRAILGAWRHNGRSSDLADSERQQRDESLGAYALGEGTLLSTGGHVLNGFLRVGFADPDVHQISRYYGAGLVWSGPLLGASEREEQLGFAVGTITNGDTFRRIQAALGSRFERHETAIELTYRLRATPWLALQPDLQYIVNPGTDPALHDAWTVGLRFELSWSTEPG